MNNRFSIKLSLLLFVAVFAGGATAVLQVQAAPEPTAIELDEFYVEWFDNVADIYWETGSESDTIGYRVRRVESVERPPVPDASYNIEVYIDDDGDLVSYIPALVDDNGFGDYYVTDHGIELGVSYWYFLVEVEANTSETVYYDEGVQVWTTDDAPTATPISIATPTSASGSGASPTETVVPVSLTPSPTVSASGDDPAPTATQTNGVVTATPQPTATPLPSATPQPQTIGGTSANGEPTATRFQFDGGQGASGGQEIAQAEATPAGDYPLPEPEGTTDDGYPADQPAEIENQIVNTSTPYPVGATESDDNVDTNSNGTIGNSGGNGNATSDQLGDSNDDATSSSLGSLPTVTDANNSQTLILWIGFIVALFIFGAGLIGSIILFARRK